MTKNKDVLPYKTNNFRGTVHRPYSATRVIQRFAEMLDKENISGINKMWWQTKVLPELYVEARKKGYWLNVTKLTDPVELKRGCRIELILFGAAQFKAKKKINKPSEDVYDVALDRLQRINVL